MAHWKDEGEEANRELLASLDELRNRADRFIAVSALATTVFALLAPGGASEGSDQNPHDAVGPDDETTLRTSSPSFQSSMSDMVPHGPTRSVTAPYPDADADEGGIVRFPYPASEPSRPCDPVIARAITSPSSVIATVGKPLSFTVTTAGEPVPSVTHKSPLPKCLSLVDNHDGTATLRGTPVSTGVYRTTIKVKFGKGTDKYVVTQAFNMTVTQGRLDWPDGDDAESGLMSPRVG